MKNFNTYKHYRFTDSNNSRWWFLGYECFNDYQCDNGLNAFWSYHVFEILFN